jgi:hypothetical protein
MTLVLDTPVVDLGRVLRDLGGAVAALPRARRVLALVPALRVMGLVTAHNEQSAIDLALD